MALRLYHFTARVYLPAITIDGLHLGDVPIDDTTRLNAVWLTDVRRPNRQKWIADTKGTILDKSEIRLAVEFPEEGDPHLIKWSDFKKHVAPQTYKVLDKTGGRLSDHWYIYRGTIPWSQVIEGTNTFDNLPLDLTLVPPPEVIEASRLISHEAQKNMEQRFKEMGISVGTWP